VSGADPAERRLDYDTLDGRSESVQWDQLVVALGSVSRVVPVPGLAENGIGF
jgi:NADH dehydrogenase